ncbi:uncharacterized protein LOC120303268 isoform X2 [Crotalus tigris]|uniref:uncharacterized protein LOC120303268 isoform X2 n=1 Tax=Crotalus tigris TaxID=88082 RepID=UPI00192F475D|nr:uncharacterized protein LOC120303268 isoform X2 [Crotalus tigris]
MEGFSPRATPAQRPNYIFFPEKDQLFGYSRLGRSPLPAKSPPTKMEMLNEFDNESPLYVSFCRRISPEDFESQSLTYTQKALRELYAHMEQNPGLCAAIVQKRKQLDSEDAGLVSYMKDSLKMDDIRKEVKQLKWEMQKVNNYALAAKKASYLTPERRTRKNLALGTFNPSPTKLGEPVVPTMPKIFGPFPSQGHH